MLQKLIQLNYNYKQFFYLIAGRPGSPFSPSEPVDPGGPGGPFGPVCPG